MKKLKKNNKNLFITWKKIFVSNNLPILHFSPIIQFFYLNQIRTFVMFTKSNIAVRRKKLGKNHCKRAEKM